MSRTMGKYGNFFKISILGLSFALLAGLAVSASLGEASLNPENPIPGESVSNQKIVFDVENLSADGDTDTFYVHLPEALEGNISVNQASIENVSITSSAELVNGIDNDSIIETVTFAVSPSDTENVDTTASIDFTATYPNESMELVFSGTVEDSITGRTEATLVETYLGEKDKENSTEEETEDNTSADETEEEDSTDSNNLTDETEDDSYDSNDDSEDSSSDSDDPTDETEDSQDQAEELNEDHNETEESSSNSTDLDGDESSEDQPQNQTPDSEEDDQKPEESGLIESIISFLEGLI